MLLPDYITGCNFLGVIHDYFYNNNDSHVYHRGSLGVRQGKLCLLYTSPENARRPFRFLGMGKLVILVILLGSCCIPEDEMMYPRNWMELNTAILCWEDG